MVDYLNLSRKTDQGCVGIGQYLPSSGPADKNTSTGQDDMKALHRLCATGSWPGLTDHVMDGDGSGRDNPGSAQHS